MYSMWRNHDGSCDIDDRTFMIHDHLSNSLYEFAFVGNESLNIDISDDFLKLHKININNKDSIYKMLYGYDEKELYDFFKNKTNKMKPKNWTKDELLRISMDDFLSAFLSFIYSNFTFKDEPWEYFKKIIIELNSQDLDFWKRVSFGKKVSPKIYQEQFYEFILLEISKDVKKYLNEEQCYNCYLYLIAIKDIIKKDEYIKLEKECCVFFDKLALQRINGASYRSFNINELSCYDIEVFFFYEEYFNLESANLKTKEFIYGKAYDLHLDLINKVIKNKHYAVAEHLLNNADKYALTIQQKNTINKLKNSIKQKVYWCKKINEIKEKWSQNACDILGVGFIIFILLSVLLLILLIIGIFVSKTLFAFSWKAFLVSLVFLITDVIIWVRNYL